MDSSSFSLTIVVAAAIGFFTLFHKKIRFHQESKTTSSSTSLALSLPSSSSSSSPRNSIHHHVFPSFHGADVRKTFLSHVLEKLRSKGIDPFIDNDIVRGKSIGPELVEAIRGSRIAIVLLSKNYASSTWCLDELVEIMKCTEDLGQTVMTLFYEVDPSDVKKQTGDFGKVFRKTCKGKTKDNIRRWVHALEEVAKIAGYHSNSWDNEAKMIEKIANDVSNELNISAPSSDFDGFVGLERHMINMRSFLRLDSEEVRIIGIWGPSGIGKTTIARFLFNRHSEEFQLSVFMENIKGWYNRLPTCSDHYSPMLYLQEKFLSQITNQKDIKIPHLGIIKDRLQDSKVLVVLDDVDQLLQLEAMAKEVGWFGSCSRIIVTTQNQTLLRKHGINHIYKVEFPSSDEALEIFCMYAFGQKSPKDGFYELAWKASKLAGKLPLGLRVMGSYFWGMSKQEWTMELPRVKKRLDRDIESILKLSYDALYEEDKKLFLHIACFFNGESVGSVEDYLAHSFKYVTHEFRVLAEKSLISMDKGMIKMHDLLVRLGKEIVRKQYVDEPWKRQFLVDGRDIDEVLNNDEADNSNVIGIYLRGSDVTCTNERAFERLPNLQFLRINDFHSSLDFSQNLSSISQKLRMLHWWFFEKPCLPSNYQTTFLVSLDMPWSWLVKLWEGIQPLSNLKWMNLGVSIYLKELPDLSTATNLQKLELSSCSSLVVIPSSIENAINLQVLVLSFCSSLVSLPQLPYSLLELNATHCESLERLDCIFRNPDICLDFSHCYKLNQEARDLIIHTPTNRYAILPGREMPDCFTYRAPGSSLTVKLNQKPLRRKTTKFMACILLQYKYSDECLYWAEVSCSITSKHNALTVCRSKIKIENYFANHLHIFEVEAEEVTSTELDFEFEVIRRHENWEIKECGVYQLRDGDEDVKSHMK